VSVGHVARAVETAGISTVGIYVAAFRHVPANMNLPRTLITPHPFGRPIGPAGAAGRHRQVIDAALDLIESATAGGTIVTMPGRFVAG
jgi:hypothetical protein